MVDLWAMSVVIRIQRRIEAILDNQSSCSVMLTAGKSAERLYRVWSDLMAFEKIKGVHFYFGDERCVPPDHPESNYRLAMDTLFMSDMQEALQIHRMEADSADLEAAADRYAVLIPKNIDVLLLSMGEDGHIASLFPHSATLHDTRRRVVPVIGPKLPFHRLTITPSVIQNAREVFVFAIGEQKRSVYEEALRNPSDIDVIPARLVLNRTWIFGD